ncbi:MAG: isoprenyl transferase [Gemmatimonadetes bacterium]|nr:isoprenyl transferase [Gemmatimonadota bacterium]
MSNELLVRLKACGDFPRHVAIIMDGNGRWARSRLLPRTLGHHAGMKSVREAVEGCIEAGVEVLTLFAFSQENWARPATEVSALMNLLDEYISKETANLRESSVRVTVLGDRNSLNSRTLTAIERVEQDTEGGTRLQLALCIAYSAREELTCAARRIAREVEAGTLDPQNIDEQSIAERLYTAAFPDPDLLIRTSGEQRISNFLLWQLAYTELYVTPVLWPDFSRTHLFEAILDFQSRERRFGRVTA